MLGNHKLASVVGSNLPGIVSLRSESYLFARLTTDEVSEANDGL